MGYFRFLPLLLLGASPLLGFGQLSQEAKAQIDSLQQVIANAQQDTVKVNAWDAWAEIVKKTDKQTAIELWENIVALTGQYFSPQQLPSISKALRVYPLKQAAALHKLGVIYHFKDHKKALDYYSRSLQINEAIGHQLGMAKTLNNIGAIYLKYGDQNKALEHFKRSLSIGEEIDDQERIAASLNSIATVYKQLGDNEKAIDFYTRSLDIKEALGDKGGAARSMFNLGLIYHDTGDLARAKDYYNQAMERFEALDYQRGIASVLTRIGSIYQEQGDHLDALSYYEHALKIRRQIGDSAGIARTLNSIGSIYKAQGNIEKAIDYHIQSLKKYEEMENKPGVASVLNSIGLIYKQQGEEAKALRYFMRSLKAYQETNNKNEEAILLKNIGWVHQDQGDRVKALDYYTRSLKICEETKNQYGIAAAYNSMASIYREEGKSAAAIDYYSRSLNIYEQLEDLGNTALLLYNIGWYHYRQKDYTTSIEYAQRALAKAEEVGQLIYVKESSELLYKSYKATNQPALALRMHEQYLNARDSLEREENQRAVIRQEYKYQYDQQALADSLKNAEAQKLAEAQLSAQKASNLQQRQQSIFIGVGLLALLLLSAFLFYRRRKALQARLEQEQQEAQRLKELDQLKTKLYTNLTHEFRTPLTVMLGMTEKIRTAPQKFLAEGTLIIERNGNNLLRIINQLLDLSKLENHSLKLHLQQNDIIPYLNYITESFHSYANGKNLSLRFFSNVEHLVMDYDPEQIKQVMTNLIANAIKFTPSGGEVKVRVLKKEGRLQIDVQDDGIGIPKEALPQIFARFYQVDDSATRAYEGTGIGLTHVKELVNLMGGQISVESILEKGGAEEKSGSTFSVVLPIQNNASLTETSLLPDVAKAIPQEAVPLLIETAPTNGELPRVLIIEDNPDVVVYLKSCLEKDYQLEVAYNGDIGIEKAINSVPDLIISDVMMPGKDGFEVCNVLKTDERTSHIPIVLLTAKADLSSKLEGLERGADAYLAKPFQEQELAIRLQNLLEGRQKMQDYFSAHYLQATPHPTTNPSTESPNEDTQIEDAFIQKVNAILQDNIEDENFGLVELRRAVGMTRSPFFRKMKALTNTTPSDYIRAYRMRQARYLLEHTDHNVAEVAYAVGFKNPSYFTKVFQKEYGIAPSTVKG
ncbi:MAG: tetratricopeptide repeat protein [Bacteroidota bacterium]